MRKYESELCEHYTAREDIFEGKIVHLVRDTVTLPNGKSATREMMLHNGAVAILQMLGKIQIAVPPLFKFLDHGLM